MQEAFTRFLFIVGGDRAMVIKANRFAIGHHTDDISCKILIWWILFYVIIHVQVTRSLHNFAHAMTAQLSWHVQNFVVIVSLKSELEINEIWVKSDG